VKHCLDLTVKAVERQNEKYSLLRLTSENELPKMLPGQFVEVRVDGSPKTFLRRPISINFVDTALNELWLLVAAVGDGTRRLVAMREGETLNCILPLGNSFTLSARKTLLVGGGVGVAPLLFLGSEMARQGNQPTFLLGARTKNDLLETQLFAKYGRLFTTTEDGSDGERGFVTNHSILLKENFEAIATCGPKPMMTAVANYARKAGIDCEMSLENKMACGLGACLCCVEKTTTGNRCVCTDGPVFNSKELIGE